MGWNSCIWSHCKVILVQFFSSSPWIRSVIFKLVDLEMSRTDLGNSFDGCRVEPQNLDPPRFELRLERKSEKVDRGVPSRVSGTLARRDKALALPLSGYFWFVWLGLNPKKTTRNCVDRLVIFHSTCQSTINKWRTRGAAPGSNHSSDENFSHMLSLWTIEIKNWTHPVLMQSILQMQSRKGLS